MADLATAEDWTPAPPIPPSEPLGKKYAGLLDWARSKSLHVDPRLGRDEPTERKQARHAARELMSLAERYDRAENDGEDPMNLSWLFDSADRYADMLTKLKSKV